MNGARQSLVQRLKIVEKERDGLEGAKDAAEAYLGKEEECTQSYCTIYQVIHQSDPLPIHQDPLP